jgi:ABC-2 type transport system permease protein
MRLYWEIARRGFRRYAAYRSATLAGAFTNTVFGVLRCYILLAVFTQRTHVGDLSASDAVTFSLLAQSTLMVTALFAGGTEIALRIRTGDIVSDLYRPVDFQRYWLAHDTGRAVYQASWRALPPFVVGALIFDVRLPHHAVTWLAFVVAMVLALLVSFGIRFLIGLSAFWLLDDRGASQLAMVVQLFLSGFLVPIQFFPHWLATVSRALPFAAMVQIPMEVFLEKHTGPALAGVFALQLGWAVALYAAGVAVLAAATRRVVIQGG